MPIRTLDNADKAPAQEAQTSAYVNIEKEEKKALEKGTKFIMDLGDGITVVKILTPKALVKESEYMYHSMGEGGYDKDLRNGSVQIYSLRDKDGLPHVTIEVRAGEIIRCEGKDGEDIAFSEYLPYVQKFVKEQKLDPKHYVAAIGLCKDTSGNIHDLCNIPAGTEFENLDISNLIITKFPPSWATCLVKKDFNCSFTHIDSFENCPEVRGRIITNNCYRLTSLKGIKEGVKEVICYDCTSLPSLVGLPGKVLEKVDCNHCQSIPDLEGCDSEALKEVDCSYCGSLFSLEGLHSNALECVDCECSIKIYLIPDHISYDAIQGMSYENIMLYKRLWRMEDRSRKRKQRREQKKAIRQEKIKEIKGKLKDFFTDKLQKTNTR